MVSRKPYVTAELPERPARAAEKPTSSEDVKELIQEIDEDLKDLSNFYNISFSPTRIHRIGEYLSERYNEIHTRFVGTFGDLDQQSKVDWHLIRNYIRRNQARLRADVKKNKVLSPLLGDWALGLVELCERRQKVEPTTGQYAAQVLSDSIAAIRLLSAEIKNGDFEMEGKAFAAFRGAQAIEELHSRLTEWFAFYKDYDPVFTWWTTKPWEELSHQLLDFVSLIREKLVGIKPGDEDTIVGQPIGREAILAELEAEVIPYSPEELIKIAEREYSWCERGAIAAATEMGFGSNWKAALEQVKTMYVEPGQQTQMVHELANEAIDYVTKHDMVTVPPIAASTWQTFMMTPAQQKVNPFFLGGESIIVSYPTSTMSHEDKLMVMRGNSRPLSRSTVFHELIPGHHLQFHYMSRSKPYRRMFETPFWIEGWAFYWELILWDRGFPGTPENKMGMLFWHMHRCARIVFSLKFHLGQMTPQECIDYLVERVGHERATAEGEVRRSFNGDYGALYQAGYMLGALQMYALRKELVQSGMMGEKEFHDRVLKENTMPVELLRALLKGEKLTAFRKPEWRFYDV